MRTTEELRGIIEKTGDSDKLDLCADIDELCAAIREAASDFVRIEEGLEPACRLSAAVQDAADLAKGSYDRLAAIDDAGVPHREIIGGAPTMRELARDLRVCINALRCIELIATRPSVLHGVPGGRESVVGGAITDIDNIAHNALDEVGDDRGAREHE